MIGSFARMTFPNESSAYRETRNALLDAEIALRRQIEAVAARRRALPQGGEVPEDYLFERIGAHSRVEQVRMSELFGEHDTLLLYSYMFGPERDVPCSGALTCSIATTAPRATSRSAPHSTWSRVRRSPASRPGRTNADGITSS